MKAKQDIFIKLDEKGRYHQNGVLTKISAGSDIPEGISNLILERNKEYVDLNSSGVLVPKVQPKVEVESKPQPKPIKTKSSKGKSK